MTTAHVTELGVIGRLGRWSADHFRVVLATWILVFAVFGVFAPFAEHVLSGAGWSAFGSESVQARERIDREFGGHGTYGLTVVVSSDEMTSNTPAFQKTVARAYAILRSDKAVSSVVRPERGASISADGKSALLRAGAAADETEMVRAVSRLRGKLESAASPGINLAVTGTPAMWADFNAENKAAMLKSEVLSWPLTLGILVLAFGSLAAAGLPLMLAILGLVAGGGALWLAGHFGDITIWAMNFALMFALAVGIDYALFIVMRFRGALRSGLAPREAVGRAMDTAGKAVLISGLAVIAALSAMMLVPSQPFQTAALGIVFAVGFVLGASLTLLPAVLARLGHRVDRLGLPWKRAVEPRSERFARWARLISRRPLALGGLAVALLVLLALPVIGLETKMPSIKVVPEGSGSRAGYERIQAAFGPGAAGLLQIVVPAEAARQTEALVAGSKKIATTLPTRQRGQFALVTAIPAVQPAAAGAVIDELRRKAPAGALIGGPVAESHDLDKALNNSIPLVYGAVLAMGFLLLVLILRAPIISAAAVALNLLATGAAFGVAKLIFQDGRLESLLGFESQGFVDAWAPLFFFALIFALAMDYTVFLLATVKERFDLTGDAREALVSGMATTGRVINMAAIVMVFVFFTFALSGPLPPKEMGVILGVAVLLDATLIRLLLLPVTLRLLGARAWWMPSLIDRWLPKVRLSH